jgi:hypothetical protein
MKLTVGNKYNWKYEKEPKLIYIGMCEPRNGRWHQFVKVDETDKVWCEVFDGDLHMIEETAEV